MITTFIQIIALIVFALALRRAIKRDRISELEFRNYIRTEIKNSAKVIISEVNGKASLSANTLLKEVLNAHRDLANKVNYTINNHSSNLANNLQAELSSLFKSTQKEVILAYDSLSSSLITIAEKQLPEALSQLEALQTPLAKLSEAQTANAIKDGEANRTLRRKLADRSEAITGLNIECTRLSAELKHVQSELSGVKSEASSFIAALVSEVDYIKAWIESKGMPLSQLDKALKQEFKANIPSREYHNLRDAQTLRKNLDLDSVSVESFLPSPSASLPPNSQAERTTHRPVEPSLPSPSASLPPNSQEAANA